MKRKDPSKPASASSKKLPNALSPIKRDGKGEFVIDLKRVVALQENASSFSVASTAGTLHFEGQLEEVAMT
jgi:hypothetical protein